MDFSSFLAQDQQEEEEDEVVESSVAPLRPEILKMKLKKRPRNDSILSDTQSIHSDISVMKELPLSQSQVVPAKKEKKEESGTKAPEETKELRSSGSVAARVYTDYFVAGTNWFAVIFMVVANIICQALYSGSDIWLSHWTAEEEVKQMEVTTKNCNKI